MSVMCLISDCKRRSNFKMPVFFFQAIQIMIGLMHIGFGTILGFMYTIYGSVWGFASLALISGYPFWGGISVSKLLQHLSISVY